MMPSNIIKQKDNFKTDIKAILTERGISLNTLCQERNVNRQCAYRYLQGKTNMTYRNLEKILDRDFRHETLLFLQKKHNAKELLLKNLNLKEIYLDRYISGNQNLSFENLLILDMILRNQL